LSHAQRQKVYGNLAGYDVDDQMVKLSKVNLFLHGFPDPAIHIYDTLSNDARWNEKADLILANPPFMTPKGGVTPHTKFRIAAKKAEVLFTDYIAEHLTADGRGGVIVPNGIVATTQNAYVRLRRFLVEDSLVAVVSLPAGVFKPYSGVKTSILLLDKKLARQTKEILFLKITADGFDLGDKRNPIEANDLPEAERVVRDWFNAVGHAKPFEPEARGGVTWQAVERKQVLELAGVPLNAERFAGGEAGYNGHHDTAKLGDLLEIQSGFPFKSELFNDTDGFPLIRIRNINPSSTTTKYRGDYAPEYVVNNGDLLIGMDGEFNATLWQGGAALLNQRVCRLHNFKGGLKEYVFYMMRRCLKEIEDSTSAVTVKHISGKQISAVEIPLPPLEEQRRIVAELEGYQKVLDGARQILAGYIPRVEVSADWPTVEIGELAEFKNGVNYSKESAGKGIKVLGVRHFQSHVVAPLDDLDEINPEGILSDGHVLEDGDLIFVRSNGSKELVGRCLLVQPNGIRVTHSAFTIRMRLDRKRCKPKFYALLLRLPEFRAQMMGGGANINNLSQDILKAIEIPLPPLEEQRRIVSELDAEAAQMEAVRSLIPVFEAKVQRVLDRVWGNVSKIT